MMIKTTRSIFGSSTGTSLSRSLAACVVVGLAGVSAGQPVVTETIPGSTVKLTFAPVPAGKVSIADPADASKKTEVEVKPFLMATTETTFDAYDIFVYGLDQTEQAPGTDATTRPSKPYIPPDRGFGHQGFAAIGMSFKGADEFCTWLSSKTGHKYRLATEAEWEHAARAGATGAYGVDAAAIGEAAWFKDNAEAKTHAVGTKKANAWGLFDMHGNVSEWVVGVDGKPVTKGGSYRDPASDLEISDRVKPSSAWNASDPQMPKSKWWLADCSFVGFRIVRELDGGGAGGKPEKKPEAVKPGPSGPKAPAPAPDKPKDRIDDHPAPPGPR